MTTHKPKVKSTKELTEELKIVLETNECLQVKVKENCVLQCDLCDFKGKEESTLQLTTNMKE